MTLDIQDEIRAGHVDLMNSRIVPSTIEYTQRWMTPDNAAAILSLYEKDDNSVSFDDLKKDPTVREYAEVMKDGGWIYNSQPILFDTDGNLIDGKKRLAASVLSEARFFTAVANNVRKDSLHTIDQHRKRNYKGVLESRGMDNAGPIQNTMSKLIRYENGLLGVENFNISWYRYDMVLDANPEILDAVRIAAEYNKCSLHSTPRPVLCFMALRAGKEKELINFLHTMSTDMHTKVTAASKLSAQMQTMRMNKTPYPVDVALALGIMAFNDFCNEVVQGKPYKWVPKPVQSKADNGEMLSLSQRRSKTVRNLGMPTVDGYRGLRGGAYDIKEGPETKTSPETMESLREGATKNEGAKPIIFMEITPELAAKWLRDNNEGNRKSQKTHIDMIARDIKAGNWMVNAQPISFTGDPFGPNAESANLLNGQHRLRAIVEAEMPVEVPISVGIAKEAFLTYDKQGKKDQSNSGGLKGDFRAVRAAAKFQWRIDQGWDPLVKRTPSETDLRNTIDKHPELADYFHEARKFKTFGSAGIMTFFLYHIFSYNKALSREFLEGMKGGAGLDNDNPLRDARSPFVGERLKVQRRYYLSLLLKAWEDFLIYKGEKEAVKEISEKDRKDTSSEEPRLL